MNNEWNYIALDTLNTIKFNQEIGFFLFVHDHAHMYKIYLSKLANKHHMV